MPQATSIIPALMNVLRIPIRIRATTQLGRVSMVRIRFFIRRWLLAWNVKYSCAGHGGVFLDARKQIVCSMLRIAAQHCEWVRSGILRAKEGRSCLDAAHIVLSKLLLRVSRLSQTAKRSF